MITYKGKEYTWDEYQKKLNEEINELNEYTEKNLKK